MFAYVKSKLSLQRDTYLFKHRIPTYRVDNALTTVLLYSFVLIFGSYLLSATERDISYIQLIFEAGSALGTVGLSRALLRNCLPGARSFWFSLCILAELEF